VLPEHYTLLAEIETKHWWFNARRAILARLLESLLPPGKGGRVVDVGCGTGANIAALGASYRCLGIDESQEGIALARKRFPGIDYLCTSDATEVARAVETADCVLLMDVLEHVEDDFRLLSSLLAPLRPGAHLVLTVPAERDLWSGHDEVAGHFRRYDPARLRATWNGLAATERLFSPFNARLYPLVRLARARRRARASPVDETPEEFRLPSAPLNRLLERVFAGEARALQRAIDRPGAAPYRRGVSLLAILRREKGELQVRDRPLDLAPDESYRGSSARALERGIETAGSHPTRA
jgi:SAM-dependent methyltransferase